MTYWLLNVIFPVYGMANKFEEIDESHYIEEVEDRASEVSISNMAEDIKE